MDRNRDSTHQSQNEDNFRPFSLGLEFLNEAEKRKTTEQETRHRRHHDSLHNAILTERHSGKIKQITDRSVPSFEGKLKFLRFKIL